jgi:hypothetical protein
MVSCEPYRTSALRLRAAEVGSHKFGAAEKKNEPKIYNRGSKGKTLLLLTLQHLWGLCPAAASSTLVLSITRRLARDLLYQIGLSELQPPIGTRTPASTDALSVYYFYAGPQKSLGFL